MAKTTFKISANTITLGLKNEGDFNTLTATTSEIFDSETATEDEFIAAAWAAIKAKVKEKHIQTYANATPDLAVINAVYKVTYNDDSKTIVIPLLSLLNKAKKGEYTNKAHMLQTATAKFLNTEYESSQKRSINKLATEKAYKSVIQWTFDLLTAQRTDGVKVFANQKDVDYISHMLLKLRNNSISTIGEPTIQAFIEFSFRAKISEKPFFTTLYSVQKEQNGVKIKYGAQKKQGVKNNKVDKKAVPTTKEKVKA